MSALSNGTVLHGKLDYKIEKCLGQGGFGITYLASGSVQLGNIKHQLPFTIKEFFMQHSCQRQPNGEMSIMVGQEESVNEHKKEFLREAERLNKLEDHQGIVSVNEIFNQNNTVYYVMEYLGNVNLEDYIKEHGGRLDEDEAIEIFRKIGEALEFLHSKKITHLDVKPANIMMRNVENGDVVPVLIDFGLAVHYGKKGDPTRENKMICCSDGYSPLEQYLGINTFSPEADVYALGATLLYILTGTKPPMASEMNANYLNECVGDKISGKLLGILKKCMGKLPEQRYSSLSDMLKELTGGNVVDIPEIDGNDGEHTRVIGQKKTVKKNKPLKPKTIQSAQKKEKTPIDTDLLKKIGIGIGAIILVGLIVFGISRCDFSASKETEEQTAIVPDTLSADSAKVVAPVEKPNEADEAKAQEPQTQTDKRNDSKQDVKSDNPKPETKNENQKPEPKQEVVEDETPTGTLDLGFGTYTGEIKKGKPDGSGTIVFKTSHKVPTNDPAADNVANPGDKVTGRFKDGKLRMGRWIKTSGESVPLVPGTI